MDQQQDTIYQAFDKNLYRVTGEEQTDSILDIMQADMDANNASAVQTAAENIGSGTGTATVQTSTGATLSGKTGFDDLTDPGFIFGVDQTDGLAKFLFGNSSSYILWDGSNLTVVGGVSVGSLNIPDTTTANSFHVDTSGNTWWGANVATGYTGANAYILNTGAASFKNVQIGGTTTQYVITNSGIFSYGDGSDGNGVCDGSTTVAGMTLSGGNYTLTRDLYFANLTLSNTTVVNPNGWRIFCSLSLTISGNASIKSNGGNGSNGSDGVGGNPGGAGGAGGTAGNAIGYLPVSLAGANGGVGKTGSASPGGSTGTSVSSSLGNNGANGGNGGSGGVATTSNVKLIANWHLATLLDITSTGATLKFQNSGGSAGGGGGTNNNSAQAGGGGGGGGGCGGYVAIYAKSITINSGSSIVVNGGNGGNGGNSISPGTNGQGGGGGGSGNGGLIILVYNNFSNSGSLTASAGTPGTGGTGGIASSNGSTGSAGSIYQFSLSL